MSLLTRGMSALLMLVLATLGMVAVNPTAAQATTDSLVATTYCGGWYAPASGTPRAEIQNCRIDWYRGSDGSYSQTLSFWLRDLLASDGLCAEARVSTTPSSTLGIARECLGNWSMSTMNFPGYHSSITISLSTGGFYAVSRTFAAPGGY